MFRKDASQLPALSDTDTDRAQDGRGYWRSLEEWSQSEEFEEYLAREFPDGVDLWGQTSRREFFKLMGASLALAGLSGCGRQPQEKIVPYVDQPEPIVPGKPLYYATAMTTAGIATGLLVESRMGRPIKIEGNPRHPSVPVAPRGGNQDTAPGMSDTFMQAELLNFYDPDRSQVVTENGQVSTWDAFQTNLRGRLEELKSSQGRGVRLLTETVTSPTQAAQFNRFLEEYPEARWHQFEPMGCDHEWAGSRLAFGEVVAAQYNIEQAEVIVSLDADFLISCSNHLRHAWEFANRRQPTQEGSKGPGMNRLYVLESTPTLTGARADHRLPLCPAEIEAFAFALASRLGVETAKADDTLLSDVARQWLDAIVGDLQCREEDGRPRPSLLLAGPSASPVIHALVHAMNNVLGNVGWTLTHTEPAAARPLQQYKSLKGLVDDMLAGDVDMLFIIGGNPVYTAPADIAISESLDHVPWSVHMGLFEDETAIRCRWHLPQCHFLETWGDARAADGTVSLIQPLIAPLYQGKSIEELLSMLLDRPRPAYELLKSHWQEHWPPGGETEPEDFEDRWEMALHEGVILNTEFPRKSVTLTSPVGWKPSGQTPRNGVTETDDPVDVVFRPDPTIGDGRFANNGWLQELPKPLTKLTWENAALIAPALAERKALVNGDVVRLQWNDHSLDAPVWIVPGHADRAVTLHLGYGRTHSGHVGTGAGFDAYRLQSHTSPWHQSGVSITPTGKTGSLAATQHHHLMQGRDLVKAGTLAEWAEAPEHPPFMQSHHHGEPTTLFPPGEHTYDGYKWGMAIDLNRCIGCSACMVACQAENNIPVVGREQVALGREMHWIRVDSYYEGDPANPRVVHQPVPCMHCEFAPCELVCPVGATVHSDEGLNEMVYNRCVGTRYCSNNCPYKVRRFNFLQFSDLETPSLTLLHNPEVTVRNRGVMEKCTYCVQRISTARIDAEKEDRTIHDGEVVTACQASCPAQAITFGNLNDPGSRISKLSDDPLNYSLLEHLNTRPRTTYLAAVRNPNPSLEPSETKAVY